MNQDISICVLSENEMGWTEPFELDKVQILDNYYLSAQKSDIAFLKKNGYCAPTGWISNDSRD